MISFQMRPSIIRLKNFVRLRNFWKLDRSLTLNAIALRTMAQWVKECFWQVTRGICIQIRNVSPSVKTIIMADRAEKKEIGKIDGQSAPKLRTWLPMATPGSACDADRCGHWKRRRNEIDRNEINQIDLPALRRAFPRPRSTYFTVAAIFLRSRTLSSFCANHNKIWRAFRLPSHPQRNWNLSIGPKHPKKWPNLRRKQLVTWLFF